MKEIRRALLEGAMVVIPVGAVVLLTIGIIQRLEEAADPLAGRYLHPLVAAILLLLILFLFVGLAVRSVMGRWARAGLESLLLERIPGYRLAKAFVGEGMPLARGDRKIRTALASIEEGQCPALVMDEFADGRLLVFVPGTPAPMSGAIYIFTPDRVVYLDIPLLPFLKSIASWGLGLPELLQQQRPADGPAGRPGHPSGSPPRRRMPGSFAGASE